MLALEEKKGKKKEESARKLSCRGVAEEWSERVAREYQAQAKQTLKNTPKILASVTLLSRTSTSCASYYPVQ